MKIRKVYISFLFILSLSCSTIFSQIENRKIVTIGYIDYPSFVVKSSNDVITGFIPEYFEKISNLTGWECNYLLLDWHKAYNALENGKIDFYAIARVSQDRKKYFDFSNFPLCNEMMNLSILQSSNLEVSDFKSETSKKVGVLLGSREKVQFTSFAKKNNFNVSIIEYESNQDAIDDLKNNQIDAVALVALATLDLKPIANFGIEPAYLISSPNSSLMEEFNEAQAQLEIMDPSFEVELFAKFFNINKSVIWTEEEHQFIEKEEPITISLIPNREPFSYVDKDGKEAGITVDILNLISKKSGLIFDYTMMKQGQRTLDYIKENPNALVAGVMADNPQFKSPKYIVSDYYYQDDVALATMPGTDYQISDSKNQYRLAISQSYMALQSIINEKYPQFIITQYNSQKSGLALLKKHKVDFLAQNVNVLRPFTQDPHYEDVQILPTFFMAENMGIVCLRTPENNHLINIINKTISTISQTEKNQFTVNHTLARGYKPTAADLAYKFRYPLSIIVTLLIILFVFLQIWSSRKKMMYAKLETLNNNLKKAIKASEAANVAKSQFLAQMSHEIRTPMNAIIGLTSIAETEIDNPENVKDYLHKISSSSKLLLGIINDVLDMSAIERGKIKLAKTPFNLQKLITSLSTVFYQQAKMKNIDFQVHINNLTQETISGDELRINQILMNLLSNAIKFTPIQGKIDLSVTQASVSQNKVQIRFEVIDNGCGMSESMQKRLFKPFEQESATTAKKHGGSGLGLSITKHLIDLMHGMIQVKSAVDKGTTFIVDIPFGKCEQVATNDKKTFESIRTLIVDDDEVACRYLGEILDRFGVRHECTQSSENVLEMIGDAEEKNDPFKLCMIDWKMPGMNGIELSKQIREIFGDDTIIIIVSAYDLNEVENIGKENGINAFIPKPLFQSSIYNALVQITGNTQAVIDNEPESSKYNFSGKKVLIAEDVSLNMEVAIKILKMVGIECVCAEDGKQAVEIFEKTEDKFFDCILMDINMPVMDGYQATKQIRSSKKPDAKTIPIYAMTANVFSTDISDALNAGMNGHIAKPIETAVLYKTLSQAFKASEK